MNEWEDVDNQDKNHRQDYKVRVIGLEEVEGYWIETEGSGVCVCVPV